MLLLMTLKEHLDILGNMYICFLSDSTFGTTLQYECFVWSRSQEVISLARPEAASNNSASSLGAKQG